MKRRDRPFLIAVIAIFAVFIVFEPSYGWRVRQWLAAGALGPAGGAGTSAAASDGAASLAAENESLKAQLAELRNIAAQLPQDPPNDIRAVVYSRYPLNFKNELLVNAGANDGVAAGDAVTFQGVFIGVVAETFPAAALVRTVFDDSFKMAVRIGSAGYDALLEGGAAPRAASIVRTADVMPGDIVFTAAPGIPYGLPVAVVAATSTSPDRLFEEAPLGFAYDINTIQSVLIAK